MQCRWKMRAARMQLRPRLTRVPTRRHRPYTHARTPANWNPPEFRIVRSSNPSHDPPPRPSTQGLSSGGGGESIDQVLQQVFALVDAAHAADTNIISRKIPDGAISKEEAYVCLALMQPLQELPRGPKLDATNPEVSSTDPSQEPTDSYKSSLTPPHPPHTHQGTEEETQSKCDEKRTITTRFHENQTMELSFQEVRGVWRQVVEVSSPSNRSAFGEKSTKIKALDERSTLVGEPGAPLTTKGSMAKSTRAKGGAKPEAKPEAKGGPKLEANKAALPAASWLVVSGCLAILLLAVSGWFTLESYQLDKPSGWRTFDRW